MAASQFKVSAKFQPLVSLFVNFATFFGTARDQTDVIGSIDRGAWVAAEQRREAGVARPGQVRAHTHNASPKSRAQSHARWQARLAWPEESLHAQSRALVEISSVCWAAEAD